jgi:PAS domain S-box-containing protein
MYHILYVDDEPGLLEIGKLYLESSGEFTVETFTSAVRALDHLKSRGYDAIVSDYQMPKMDGITFLKTLREGGNTTPFIIFTGRGREEVVIEALNSGADFYLQKGGDPEPQYAELAHKIHRAISRKQAGQALEKSERDYRHLIEHANEAIFVVQDERFVMINPRSAGLSGYKEEEILGQPFSRFVHPEDRDVLLAHFRRRMAGDQSVTSHYTFRICRKDGAIRWVELSVVAITWDDHPAILNFMTDVTDRRQAEDALRESEERYRRYFKTTLDSVFITTPEGKWIDFNDATVEMFGYSSRVEVFSMSVPEFYVHPEERRSFLEIVARDGYVKEHYVKLKKRDGTVFDSLITIVPQRNPDGSVKAFVGTIRDITDRKKTEEALRESETRYRQIFDTFDDLYYQTDMDGNLTVLSPSIKRLTGFTAGDLIGKPAAMIYVNPADRAHLLGEIARNGFVRDYELLLRKQDGTEVPASLNANRVYDDDGRPAGVAGILRDVTRSKHAEERLRESEEKFRSLVEYGLEAILILDLQGTVLFANRAAARTIETAEPANLVGRNVMEVIAPGSRADVMKDFEQVARGHDAFLARYHVITAKGREIQVESIGKIITYEGRPADLISLREITERKDT